MGTLNVEADSNNLSIPAMLRIDSILISFNLLFC